MKELIMKNSKPDIVKDLKKLGHKTSMNKPLEAQRPYS